MSIIYVLIAVNLNFLFFIISIIYKTWTIQRQRDLFEFEQEKLLLKQRIDIGNDLHDNLGSTLSSLHIYSSIAMRCIDDSPSKVMENLKNISTVTNTIMNQINDVIWSISPKNTNVSLLSSRIKDYFIDIFDSSNIICNYNVDQNAEFLITGIKARKNMLLIIKESINNAIKYSKCDLIKLTIIKENQNIKLAIEDNGIGIGKPDFSKGNGLTNLKSRTDELNGYFFVKNIHPNGTLIECLFPITSISL